MLSVAPAHPNTKFDLYHLGMPMVRDTIVIAKNYPNVYLNLCWTHIISQAQTCSGIDELLDQVPVNKVLAFGGDYGRPVEKVVGHLHMAREDYAGVFGARIDAGMMSFGDAMGILRLWFWENPLRLYDRLKV
jgi:predicted TIM-barrel fold metal-dependent hydrolase